MENVKCKMEDVTPFYILPLPSYIKKHVLR